MTEHPHAGWIDDEDLRRRTERVLVDMFLSMRGLHLGIGLAHLVLQRSSFQRPRLAWLGLGLSAGATAFVGVRMRREDASTDSLAVLVDVTAQMTAVRLGGAALVPGQGTGQENIGFLPSIWSAAAVSPWSQLPMGIAATLALAANWGMVGGRLTPRARWQTAFSTLSLHFGVFGVGAFFARALRNSAEAAMRARAEALADAQALAIQESRRELRARVHRQAVAALREIRETLPIDREQARERARSEARRLRRLIGGETDLGTDHLMEIVADPVARAIASGLRVDLQVDGIRVPSTEVCAAIVRVLDAALDNVRQHARTSSVVVRIVTDVDGSRVTVRDHGVGCVPPDAGWVPPSLARAAVGLLGVACTTDPGRGMRIVAEEARS